MSSVQHLRDFISERLAAAAGEIFTEFEKTIVQLEEQIDRQRRLLEISWKPQVNLHRLDLSQLHVWKEEEVLTNQQLWNQGRNSSLEQEEAESPQMKEEQDDPEPLQMIEEEHCVSQDQQQLVLKQETDTLMVIPPSEEIDCSKPEANWDQPLSQNHPEAENQDQKGSKDENSESDRDEELRQNKRCQQTKSHRENLDNPKLKSHPETQTELPADDRQLVLIKGEAPGEWRPDVNQQDPEPLNIKEGEDKLWTSLEEEKLNIEEETNATRLPFPTVPLKSEGDEKKPLLSQHQVVSASSSTDQMTAATGGEDCGGAETIRNPGISNTQEEDYSSSQTEVSEDDEEDDHVNNPDSQLSDTGSRTEDGNNNRKEIRSPESGVGRGETSRKVQTRQKPYVCDLCGKRFTRKATIKIHTRVHTGERPFCCVDCGQSFSQNLHSNSHMMIHTGQRPLCCGQGFKRIAYKADFKLKAICYAVEHGNRAAAREFNINESMVRKWRKQEDDLRQVKKTKRSFRGKKARWPQLEDQVEQWVIEQRTAGRNVSTVSIRLKATAIAHDMKINDFQGGPSWCFRFMKRRHLSIRTRTTISQQLPKNYEEKLAIFRT